MSKTIAKKHSTTLYAALAIMSAIAVRQIEAVDHGLFDLALTVLRGSIYVVFFAIWGLSAQQRLTQMQLRVYVRSIAALMMFWMAVRTIRYCLDSALSLSRWLWYLYYLPMLWIPLLGVLIAFSIGKPDNYHLPAWTALLYLPSLALFLLVITNDMHQLVFSFPAESLDWADDYQYGPGYFLTVFWIVFCGFMTLVPMLVKCRIPRSRIVLLLPFVPTAAAIGYVLLYILHIPWLRVIAGDMTVVFCLLFIAILESCIACGLIQSNTGYEELFMVSSLGILIMDHQNAVCLASADAEEFSPAQRIQAQSQPVLAEHHKLLMSKPISFGYMLWQTDVSEIAEAIEQIEENNATLAERNRIRQETIETQKKILALQERNRITDLINKETAHQIDRIECLLTQYDAETEQNRRRMLLAGMTIVGAYIKRYGNLLLISQRASSADIHDLSRCFDESFRNLEQLGVNCLQQLPTGISLPTQDMLRVYQSFETIVEAGMFELHQIWVQMRKKEDAYLLTMEFVSDSDLSSFATMADAFSFEEEAWRFTYQIHPGR